MSFQEIVDNLIDSIMADKALKEGNFVDLKDFLREIENGEESLIWLKRVIPQFFPDTEFEIDTIPTEENDKDMLTVKIYGNLAPKEFREQRHALCNAMREAGYHKLYEVMNIFQKRTKKEGEEK